MTGFRPARRPTWPTTPTTTSGRARSTTCPPATTSTRRHSTTPGTRTTGSTPSRTTAPTSRSTCSDVTSVKFYYDHKSHWITDNQRLDRSPWRRAASSPSWAAPATGIRAASGHGCRTSTATASTRSRRPRCRPARTRPRSRSTRAGTRTTAPAASRTGRTSRSPSPPTARRSPSPTTRRRTSSRSWSPSIMARRAARARCRTSTWPARTAWARLGTRTSKVWYTVAGGILSDVYYPTVDNTNVETLQYIVTDGATFTDLQARDMTYTVEAVTDTGGMACRVTASDKDGLYSIETTYITDPSRNTVLMRVAFTPKPKPNEPGLQLYVRFDPTVNGNGGGGGGQRRGRHGDRRRHERPSDPRGVRPGHRDQRRQPGLCPAGLRRPRRPVRRGFRRVRRRRRATASSSSTTRTRSTPTYPDAREGNVVGTARLALDGSGKTAAGPRVRRERRRGDRHGGRRRGRPASTRPSMPTSPAGTPTTRR